MPGAVPLLFKITLQLSGTSACLKLRSIMGLFRMFSKMFFTLANAPASTTILPLKYLQSNGLVMSSAVGPSPPVIRMISAWLLSSCSAVQISSHTSPTATRLTTLMPALLNSCAIQALLVSITCPINNSSPMVMMLACVIL